MVSEGLLPGFAEPVFDAQRVFRVILDAMARPGVIGQLPVGPAPRPLQPATAAVALALIDCDTPLWLDPASRGVADYLRFHCGCRPTEDIKTAAFAIITDVAAMPPLSAFAQGTDDFPDRSATLILQVPTLIEGDPWDLSGPGIRATRRFRPGGLPAGFREWLADNHAVFPRGVDLVFACGTTVAALPRTTRLEV